MFNDKFTDERYNLTDEKKALAIDILRPSPREQS